jgi:hypothetical protein
LIDILQNPLPEQKLDVKIVGAKQNDEAQDEIYHCEKRGDSSETRPQIFHVMLQCLTNFQ